MAKEIQKANRLIQEAILLNKPIIVLDVETEGLSPQKHKIIQISALKLNPKDFSVTEKLNEYINPLRPLTDKITEITGYTNEFISKFPSEETVFPKVYNFFEDEPICIGHNVSFDIRMLEALYSRQGEILVADEIDTCQMAREVLNNLVKDHKLGTVAEYYGANIGLNFHNSKDDVIATLRIFKAMYSHQKTQETKRLHRVTANQIEYFEGFRGHSRIYINTDEGSIYYDTLNAAYGSKDIDLSKLDMEDFERQILRKWQVTNVKDLFKKVQSWYYKRCDDQVGKYKEFTDEEKAKKFANVMAKSKRFDVTIYRKDNLYKVTIDAFVKKKIGKVTISY